MSCGSHHSTPCREVLGALFIYLDSELSDPNQNHAITIHLEECSPCQGRFDYELKVRHLISTACQEAAPEELRTKVSQYITEIRLTLTEINLSDL